MERSRVIVVGGGVGGLTAAVRLQHGGHHVTLLEKNRTLGGKLNTWESEGFRFDTGPSLITLPQVFRELFSDLGERVEDYLNLQRLDPLQRFVFPDGTVATLTGEGRLVGLGEAAEREFEDFLARGKRIWDLSAEMFLWHSPEEMMRQGPFDWRKGLSMLTIPARIGMFSRYAAEVHRRVRHPRVREILYQYATYAGASPFKAPGTLAVIPYAEAGFGGWYVAGGLYRIAEVLADLLRRRGGVIRTSTEATRLQIAQGKITGVRLAMGEVLPADAVVVNMDVVPAYRRLVPAEHRPHFPDTKLTKLEPGGSGMILLLGVRGTYPQLAHHTKFMPADYRSDLAAMFETRTVPADPCIYVCATTRTDSTVAPPDCENLFVLVSAPPLDGKLDWQKEGRRYRDQVLGTLETRCGLTNLRSRLVTQRTITPADLEANYHANAGSIYGLSSNSRLGAFLRPPNRDKHLSNLFFAGGATHPGGGLPLVTLSGKIVAEMIMAGSK